MSRNSWFTLFIVLILLAACQNQPDTVPTLVEFPSETMSDQASPVVRPSPAAISAVVTTTETPVPTFTPVPTASATQTVFASPTATRTPSPTLTANATPTLTATPTRCGPTAFSPVWASRINFAYSEPLQNLFADSDLPLITVAIQDLSWEEGYCPEADEWVAYFQECVTLAVELQLDAETFYDQDQRAGYLEAILPVVAHFDACNPGILEIIFHSPEATVHWAVSLVDIQNAYEAGERGLSLYAQGREFVPSN